MSLYKQPSSDLWWFQIWFPGRKRVRKSTGTSNRAKAAAIEHTFSMAYGKQTTPARLHAMIDAVCGTDRGGLPVVSIWETYTKWLAAAGKIVADITLRKRKNAVDRFVAWTKEHWPAATTAESVDRKVASAFASALADSGTKGKTRKNIISDLSTVWEGLRRVTDDLQNPWPLVRPEANDSERGQPFTREQEEAVLDAAKKARSGWYLACLIARWTGLRYSSGARLTWKEVDLKAGLIRHTPPKTKKHGITVILPLSKPLHNALEEALRDRGQLQERAVRPNAKLRKQSADYVLPQHAAYYPRPEMAGGPGAFIDILTAAKVTGEGYTFHSWRHTFRTRLSEAGVSDDLAKRLGGWTEDATAARYDHAERVEELRAAVEKAR
ncbi:MAG: tyrosine-type recombinase/integrase [bacterium]